MRLHRPQGSDRPAFRRFRGFASAGQMRLLAHAARGEASMRQADGGAGEVDRASRHAIPPQRRDGGGDAQALAGGGVKALDQIPGGIERGLIIGEAHPEGGQRHDMRGIAHIGAAHFDELLGARLGKTVVI